VAADGAGQPRRGGRGGFRNDPLSELAFEISVLGVPVNLLELFRADQDAENWLAMVVERVAIRHNEQVAKEKAAMSK
jgi:hypothetical protein